MVRHLGHVPGHGPAQRDPHSLAGRRPDRSRPQRAGHGQQRHGEPQREHVGRFTEGTGAQWSEGSAGPCSGEDSLIHFELNPKLDAIFLLIGAFLLLPSGPQTAGGRSCFLMHTSTSSSSSIPPSLSSSPPGLVSPLLLSFPPSYPPY